MNIDIIRECPVANTPRVVQVAGMFDVPIAEKSRVEIKGTLPIEEREWSVGLIVGPSGCGKTTIARELFGTAMIGDFAWPPDRSILDGFPADAGIKTITSLLNAVGFGSVPNWLRPFQVLSNGEQFRATVARALAETSDLVVIDEFTSVVDRQVAKIASHCIQKTVRRSERKLIAIACHYDIVEWLQPDWVYEPHLAAFEWRSLQRRPEIAVEIRSVNKDVWPIFSRYHYLSSRLAPQAVCLSGFIAGQCVAFTSAKRFVHPIAKNLYQEHRTVVLPDYQGLGLGAILSDWLGAALWRRGWRLHVTIGHPAVIAYKGRSPRWQALQSGFLSDGGKNNGFPSLRRHYRGFSSRRISASFAFTPPAGTPSASRPQPLDDLKVN
jgi:hypothetical protein